MTQIELNQFWNARENKIWVVMLTSTGRDNNTDRMIVRAKTKQGAFKCAKENSITFRARKCFYSARFADPVSDLHCVERKTNKHGVTNDKKTTL